mgnify:CR=1 FL=1
MFFLAAAVIFSVVWTKEKDGRADQKIKQGVVRFHIRANSDSRKDQAEKLLVRDQVVAYLKPYMEQANTKEDAKRILNSRKKEIAKVAKSTLQKRGKESTGQSLSDQREVSRKGLWQLCVSRGNLRCAENRSRKCQWT